MRPRPFCLLGSLLFCVACGDDPADPSPSGPGGSSPSSSSQSGSGGSDASGGSGGQGAAGGSGGGTPTECSVDLGLRSVQAVLADQADPCRPWVDSVHGRVAAVTFASGSIWSRRTEYGTGILATAAHVWSPCPHEGADCAASLWNPKTAEGGAFVKLSAVGGGPPQAVWSAHFPLFNELIPAAENNGNLSAVLPRHDVTLLAVDSQAFEDDGTSIAHVPEPIVDDELPLYDPDGLTTARTTWANPGAGDRLLLLGYPAGGDHPGELAASVARVLTDAEVESALASLAAAGDEEGGISYDPEAEIIVEGHAIVGMSGGGAFDEAGLQVGVLVRASTAEIGVQYVRLVRLSYVVARIEAAKAEAPEVAALAAPYLEQ